MSRYQFPATATTDASLLVSGTLADARLSSNVALENVANVFTAKQSFSGTSHSGLCLHSLTSAEYNALTPANGDLFRDSTTDRVDARLARGTVELVDTAGGQTINGALTVNGNASFAAAIRSSNANGILLSTNGSFNDGVRFQQLAGNGKVRIANFAATGGGYLDVNTADTFVFRNLADSASGNVTLGNLTASGTVTNQGIRLLQSAGGTLRGLLNCPAWATSYVSLQNGTLAESAANSAINQSALGETVVNAASGRSLFLRNNNSTIVEVTATGAAVTGTLTLGTYTVGTLPSASANTRARAFVTDSNLAFNSTNLGSTVTAGGSTLVPVFSNGTNWVIG